MATDVQDRVEQILVRDSVRQLIGTAVSEALIGVGNRVSRRVSATRKNSSQKLSGVRGVAAGAGVAALAPVAVKGIGRLLRANGTENLAKAPANAIKQTASKVTDALPGQSRTTRRRSSTSRRGGASSTSRRSGARSTSQRSGTRSQSSRSSSKQTASRSKSSNRRGAASSSKSRSTTRARGSSNHRSSSGSAKGSSRTRSTRRS